MPAIVVFIVSTLLALWMSAGRALFGLAGDLTIWYVPTIGLTYSLLGLWLWRLLVKTGRNGFRTSRATWAWLIASWVFAIAFGFLAPDSVGGQLTSIVSHGGGDTALEMAIALSNPAGIIAFTLLGVAIGFAMHDARGPRAEEVPDDADFIPMPKHPLA